MHLTRIHHRYPPPHPLPRLPKTAVLIEKPPRVTALYTRIIPPPVDYTRPGIYWFVARSRAVPRLVQNSPDTFPLLSSTAMTNEGRSRVPVRTGYMYSGQL
jgi:hypothetical protein